MLETVTITGNDLTIERSGKADPKRKRPERFASSDTTDHARSPEHGLTIDEMLSLPNPYHDAVAHQRALTQRRGQHEQAPVTAA